MISRRSLLASTAALTLCAAAAPPVLRLGILPFGSVHWVADVIQRHGLDRAHQFSLQTSKLAGSDASRVALLAQSVDVAVSDWPFVAAQRAKGGKLCFAPFSSALGGVMVARGSTVSALADLKGLRLGVAGGPADKSWLIVQAAARAQGIDLTQASTLSYGAPPLLGGLLQKGALDAVLTFWPNAARLEAAGFREAFSVADCAEALGLPGSLDLVGYVFDEDWAHVNHAAITGFLAASASAIELLHAGDADAEWIATRPLMDLPPGAEGDALFASLRRRFIRGIHRPRADQEIAQATAVLKAIGGAPLPQGVFWRGDDAG